MGVMRCHRGDCENVMCERYSDAYGYICYDCMDELVGLGVLSGPEIRAFMESKVGHNNADATFAYYDAVFPKIGRIDCDDDLY